MIYNTAVKKETVNESAQSLLENMLYITESEGKMFDSLIMIDFMDALNEADLDTQEDDSETGSGINPAMDQDTMPEEKKKTIIDVIKKIGERILKLLTDAWEAVKKAFGALASKLGQILGTNKGLVAKYEKAVLDARNIVDFEGVENFPKNVIAADDAANPRKYMNFTSYIDRVKAITDKEASDRTALIDELKKQIETTSKDIDESYQKFYAPVEGVYKPTVEDMKKFLDILSGKKDLKAQISASGSESLKAIDTARKAAKEQLSQVENKLRQKQDQNYAAAWKDFYTASALLTKLVNITTQAHLRSVATQVKAARKIVIAVGNFALGIAKTGKPSDDVKEEAAAFREMLMYKSDVYVESVFGI